MNVERSTVEIVPLRPDRWETWRDLRLRALATDPDAFGAALAIEAGHTEPDWRATLTHLRAVVALDGDVPVGIGATYPDGEDHAVVAMWVVPEARGHGIGTVLLNHVLDSLTGRPGSVVLWVADGNPARRLYERAGFVDTGERAPIRPGASLGKARLRRQAPIEH